MVTRARFDTAGFPYAARGGQDRARGGSTRRRAQSHMLSMSGSRRAAVRSHERSHQRKQNSRPHWHTRAWVFPTICLLTPRVDLHAKRSQRKCIAPATADLATTPLAGDGGPDCPMRLAPSGISSHHAVHVAHQLAYWLSARLPTHNRARRRAIACA